jgi:hypothetical protein
MVERNCNGRDSELGRDGVGKQLRRWDGLYGVLVVVGLNIMVD